VDHREGVRLSGDQLSFSSRPTLLAALLHEREREITTPMVDLLITTVCRIGAQTDCKVIEELTSR
jgi:hypothetical protein